MCKISSHTCAINWIILTKMLRGMSRGTTLLDPLGNRVEMMEVRRLRRKSEKIIFHQLITVTGIKIYHHYNCHWQHVKLHAPISGVNIITSVWLCCSHTWSWSCRPTVADTMTPALHGPFSDPCSGKKKKKTDYIKTVQSFYHIYYSYFSIYFDCWNMKILFILKCCCLQIHPPIYYNW